MTNQQKTNIAFSEKILRKRNKVLMCAFYNSSLFKSEMDLIISEVLNKEFGIEGHMLKLRLYKYLEHTKKIGDVVGYYEIVKSINSQFLKDRRRDISLTIKQYKRGN